MATTMTGALSVRTCCADVQRIIGRHSLLTVVVHD
jgi:hypothetical protein